MFSAAFQFLRNKQSLIANYVLLGLVLAVGGLALSFFVSRAELRTELRNSQDYAEQLSKRLTLTEAAYEMTQKSLETLTMLRKDDAKHVLYLQDKVNALDTRSHNIRQQLSSLKVTNEKVQELYRIRIDRALICVLEPTQCGTDGGSEVGGSGPKPSIDGAVPAPIDR